MRVSLAEVGRRARKELVFAQRDSRTVLHHAYCEVPFKITRVLNWRQTAADEARSSFKLDLNEHLLTKSVFALGIAPVRSG
jgi:urease accessory protein UreH